MKCLPVDALVEYAVSRSLIGDCDRVWAKNRILEVMNLDACETPCETAPNELEAILRRLNDDAVSRGVCGYGTAARDLFDTRLMGALTPPPHEVRAKFAELYAHSPEAATDWFYVFCQDTNYIRRYRTARDLRWKYRSACGDLDITINLAKPEKDPRDIAADGKAAQGGYPKCLLCRENEGYSGNSGHPARQNHRVIPVTLCGGQWYFQYSPYVYYNEHCLVLNEKHVPMRIDGPAFRRLLEFITCFPHYFIGSNSDLPIVGGSILSHDHYQGGRCVFPIEKAGAETVVGFRGFENVRAWIVKWPMSTLRLQSADRGELAELADKILRVWRGYTDESAFIYAETDGVPHNTVTPIARRRDVGYELDLILRNNITTKEHPLGVFHPHENLHHIKKENIGLIEAMGLAVLPSRLKTELESLKAALVSGTDIGDDPALIKHADWAKELAGKYAFTDENADAILKNEVGKVFELVLEDAGVFKRTEKGRVAFMRFADAVNREA